MNWTPLRSTEELNSLIALSHTNPQVIFKHSTRCSISTVAKNRLEKEDQPPALAFHYLDLLQHRNLSNNIASLFDVEHESPQVLLIKNGKCTYNESHLAIAMDEILEQLN
jgi:bacillithiol system protein YtxJ